MVDILVKNIVSKFSAVNLSLTTWKILKNKGC